MFFRCEAVLYKVRISLHVVNDIVVPIEPTVKTADVLFVSQKDADETLYPTLEMSDIYLVYKGEPACQNNSFYCCTGKI